LVTAGTLLTCGTQISIPSLLVPSFRMSFWNLVSPTTFSGWCCEYSTLNSPQSNGWSQGYLLNAQDGLMVRSCRAMKRGGSSTFLVNGGHVS
jgi:hypothetical protein